MLGFNTGLLSDIGRPRTVAAQGGGGDYTEALTVTLAPVVQPGVNAAPSPVWFEVADVTGCDAGNPGAGQVRIPKFHDITYVWDFGDAANATPSTAAALRMPAAWKDINRGYGMQAVHVYSTPGTYTVTVTAYERGAQRRMGSASVQVTIGDPKVVFPGSRTIIFNPGGAVNLTPYGYVGATVVTTNWAAVTSARNGNAAQTAQILIAPGVTISNTQLVNDPSWANIRIGGLDPAVKPVVRDYVTEGNAFLIRDYNTAKSERVVFGLRFVGDWDSTTETGRILRPFGTFNTTNPAGYLAMQHRCEFTGWEVVSAHIGNSTNPVYNVHSELEVTNWQNYGLHGCNDGPNRTAVIGCAVFQHPDALSGGAKDTGFYNNHGPFRDFSSRSVCMSVCDLFSRNGWSAGGTGLDGLSVSADQACIRLNTTGVDGVKANVERVSLEGMIWLEEQDSTNVDRPGNYVFDKFIQVLGPRTLNQGNEVRVGGCTFRNGLGVILNLPSAQNNRPGEWFWLSNDDGSTTPFSNDQGIDIHNCTLLDLRSNANANNVTVVLSKDDTVPGNAFADVTVENNIVHQPNRSPPVEPDGPLNTGTSAGIIPRHKGPRFNFLSESGTLAAAVAPNAGFTLSYSDVRTTRYNPGLTDSGAPTDQAWFLANAGTRHKLVMGTATLHAQVAANFEVAFGTTGITVTNRSAATWAAGTAWSLMLDRAAAIPPFDPQFSPGNFEVPLARPQAGNATATAGLRAYDDLLGAVRPASGDTRGALLP